MSGLRYLTVGNVFSVMQDSCNPETGIMHLYLICCTVHRLLLIYYDNLKLKYKHLGRNNKRLY